MINNYTEDDALFNDTFRLTHPSDEISPLQDKTLDAIVPKVFIKWLSENSCTMVFEAYTNGGFGFTLQKTPHCSLTDQVTLPFSPMFETQSDLLSWWKENEKQLSHFSEKIYPKIPTEMGIVYDVNYFAMSDLQKWLRNQQSTQNKE